jgi:type I restriction enzyme S subunit
MGLTDILLGELIEPCNENNRGETYGLDLVKGISTGKVFIETKANMEDVSLKSYLLVKPQQFAFVPDTSRRGDKIALAFNNSQGTNLISSIYQVFQVKDTSRLLPEYLYMWFRRTEFDRYARFNSWGSAREVFSYTDMCAIPLKLPSPNVQQKAVDAYNAINANLAAYADGLQDLKTTCQAYIEKLAKEYPLEDIGEYIQPCIERNTNEIYGLGSVKGISIQKCFIETKANMEDVSLKPYILVEPNAFAFVPTTSRNGGKITIALNQSSETCVVSSSYEVFKVKDSEQLVPEYLFLWLSRPEFDRYARYNSWGSAREVFSYFDLCKVRIPIPPKPIQQSIVDIYHAQFERQEVTEFLNKTLREICPILIRQSLTT